MMRFFWERQEGQSLIVVTGAFALLLGAVAFGIDQGYGFVQRRTMVNAAQAGALAAGRLLAQSVILTDSGSPVFTTSEEDVYAQVRLFAQDNIGSTASTSAHTLTVEFLQKDGTSEGSITCPLADAGCPASSGTDIDPDVRDIRVTSGIGYRTLFASVIGQPTLAASGRARSRIVGAHVSSAGGPPRAIVRHYDPADFDGTGCTAPCQDPTAADIVTFWDSNPATGDHTTFSNFKGVIGFSRYSTRDSAYEQLITGWDQSHSNYASPSVPTWPDVTNPAKCTGGTDELGNPNGFDTRGSATGDKIYEKGCSIPNWNYYGFYGRIDLDTDWSSPPGGAESPSDLGTRPLMCNAGTPAYLSAPSCSPNGNGAYVLGDWTETATGTWGSNIADTLKAAIEEWGVETDLTNVDIPGTSTKFGKALVLTVLLWDCAETYTASDPAGSRWDMIYPTGGGTDCSDVDSWPGNAAPDRVHIFTAAKFTFYYGLVANASIGGF